MPAPILILTSFVVGILIGLTSMGGAALMTPFLIAAVGVQPLFAVGTDLVYSSITKILGAWVHYRHGKVDVRTACYLASGSIPGSFLGFSSLKLVQRMGMDANVYLKHALGIMLVLVAATVLFRAFWPNAGVSFTIPKQHVRKLTIAWGALVGFGVGMTSVGSGSLTAPFLILLYAESPDRLVATDVFHAAFLVGATALLYGGSGQVEWGLVPLLLAGSLPGVVLGSYLSRHVPALKLRLVLGIVLFATGIRMI
jgi:uncharacterized membrane protein YfcA